MALATIKGEKTLAGRPNQVWARDITYIPMPRGFVILASMAFNALAFAAR